MENNLRERIEGMVERLEKRITQLKQFAAKYEAEGNTQCYYDCNIKSAQLDMVQRQLQTILDETK